MVGWVLAIFLVSSSFSAILCALPGSSNLNCSHERSVHLGINNEEYTGILEIVRGLGENDTLVLEPHNHPSHLDFLELNVTTGNASFALIQTRKSLDAEALRGTGGRFYYAIRCTNTGVKHLRFLILNDINDNPPIFEKDEYQANVLETLDVGSWALAVRAVDADLSPGETKYTILPPVPSAFEVRAGGSIFLTQPLDYNSRSSYTFTVQATDPGGFSDTTNVTINVQDFDNLYPYFQYTLYETTVKENWVGSVSSVHPDAILALDGDTGINEKLIYSVISVSPSKYEKDLVIDPDTGVLTVMNALDSEEVASIHVHMKASQQDDNQKTTDTTLLVLVADLPEAPVFSNDIYVAQIFSTDPYKYPVVKVKATDPDVRETETLQYSLVEPSSLLGVEPSTGQVYVVSASSLSGVVSMQVKAEDQGGLSGVTTVEVTVIDSGSNSVAVLSLNTDIQIVEDSALQVEQSLGRVLGWTVRMTGVTDNAQVIQREVQPKTYVSIIAMEPNSTAVLHKDQVKQRLQSEKESVRAELAKLFGPGLEIAVEEGTTGPVIHTDNQSTVITLGVFLGIFMALVPVSVFITRRLSRQNPNGGTLMTMEQLDTSRP